MSLDGGSQRQLQPRMCHFSDAPRLCSPDGFLLQLLQTYSDQDTVNKIRENQKEKEKSYFTITPVLFREWLSFYSNFWISHEGIKLRQE